MYTFFYITTGIILGGFIYKKYDIKKLLLQSKSKKINRCSRCGADHFDLSCLYSNQSSGKTTIS